MAIAVAAASGAVLGAVLGPPPATRTERSMAPRPVMLWAWERPEDLTFLDPRAAGVSLLVGTVHLRRGLVYESPRLQPLSIPDGTLVVPVVRIETDPIHPPSLGNLQRQELLAALDRLVGLERCQALQIDFDAVVSERRFYAQVLRDVRASLPPGAFLSITALASWCLGDVWLDGLPIDEAVPMLFRMGPDAAEVRARLAAGEDFASPRCRRSYGLSSDEPIPSLVPGRRCYVFHPAPWTNSANCDAQSRIEGARR